MVTNRRNPFIAAHDYDKVGLDADRCLTLALVVGDHVVNRHHSEIKVTFDQATDLTPDRRGAWRRGRA